MDKGETPISHDHHYVAKTYLAGFTRSGKKKDALWVHDLENKIVRQATPNSVGHQRDLYAVEIPGIREDAFETAFGKVETMAGPVLKTIANTGEFPTGEAFEILANFIALSYVRTPGFIRHLYAQSERMQRFNMQFLAQDKAAFYTMTRDMEAEGINLGKTDLEKVRQMFIDGNYELEQGNTFFMDQAVQLSDVIIQSVNGRKWIVLTSDSSTGHFITTDHPVRLDWRPEVSERNVPPGFMTSNTTITFPVGKYVALVGLLDRPIRDLKTIYVQATSQEVADTNSHVILSARKYIFSPEDDYTFGTSSGFELLSSRSDVKRLKPRF